MHETDTAPWEHEHSFGLERRSSGERRTRWVVGLTVVMMVAEIAAGMWFGSMALLADGWHMGTHAAALGIALFAYRYARQHANDRRYTFGTGKVSALGGFASAVGLAVVALMVGAESVARLAAPIDIRFDEAIGVAVVGLLVNLASAALLHDDHHHHHHHHDHDGHAHHHHDHNLRGAYLHVLADALTSVLAIAALIAGRQWGWTWMDPAMGIVGAVIIGRWSMGLLSNTSDVLLDAEVAPTIHGQVKAAIETDADNRVVDLHLWRVGPSHLAAIVSIVSHTPRDPGHYRSLLEPFQDLAHVTIEVHQCPAERQSVPAPGR